MERHHAHLRTAPTSSVDDDGVTYALRELGPTGSVPVVFQNHLTATLDNWDPRVVDGFARNHHVIAIDYRGVGSSTGRARTRVEDMADDAVGAITALGHSRVDLHGFSLGAMVAQVIALRHPELVRKLILTGTGPGRGGHRQGHAPDAARHRPRRADIQRIPRPTCSSRAPRTASTRPLPSSTG